MFTPLKRAQVFQNFRHDRHCCALWLRCAFVLHGAGDSRERGVVSIVEAYISHGVTVCFAVTCEDERSSVPWLVGGFLYTHHFKKEMGTHHASAILVCVLDEKSFRVSPYAC